MPFSFLFNKNNSVTVIRTLGQNWIYGWSDEYRMYMCFNHFWSGCLLFHCSKYLEVCKNNLHGIIVSVSFFFLHFKRNLHLVWHWNWKMIEFIQKCYFLFKVIIRSFLGFFFALALALFLCMFISISLAEDGGLFDMLIEWKMRVVWNRNQNQNWNKFCVFHFFFHNFYDLTWVAMFGGDGGVTCGCMLWPMEKI